MRNPNDPPQIRPESQEYLWWVAGAEANQRANDEGLTYEQKDVRATLDALMHLKPLPAEDLVHALASIYCPNKLRRRFRR